MRARAGRGAWRRAAGVVAAVLSAGSLLVLTPAPAAADQPPQFLDEWGTVAASEADFRDPVSVAIAPTRELFVLDPTRDRLLVFGTDGTLLRSWADTSSTRITVSPTTGNVWSIAQCEVREQTADGTLVRSLNAIAGGCLFQYGLDLAVAPTGDIYVLENLLTWQTETPRVRVYSGATGRQVRSWTGASSGAGALTDPSAIAVAANGNVYLADPIRDDVQEFTPTGTFVRGWGSSGSGAGQFQYARDLAVAGDGSVRVADASLGRVQRFDTAGNLLDTFGQAGSEPGALTDPDNLSIENLDLALDPVSGDVVVADTSNRRIQRFSSSGTFLGLRGYFEAEGRVVQPFDVATDAAGNAYVTETGANRVEVFDPNGQFLRTWRRADNPGGVLGDPRGIAVSASGDVFVADAAHGRIQRYDDDGTQISAFGAQGTGAGQLDEPTYLALDGSGLLYVGDAGNDRVSVFTTDGAFVRSFGTRGTADGQFKGVAGIAVGPDGNVYVGDNNSTSGGAAAPRIQRFSPTGAFLGKWGAAGTGDGQFGTIRDLVANAAGRIYASDCGAADRVQVFDLAGTALASWGADDGGFAGCDSGIALSDRWVYHATDRNNGSEDDRIVRYEYPTGGLMSATITVDETDVMAGATVHYHVTIDNLGGVPLTGVATEDTAGSSCSRSVPDIPVGDRYRFDCTYEVTAADSGWFPNAVTVTSVEAAPATSDPARVDVSAFGAPVTARTWWPSATGADDAPLTGPTGLTADGDGHLYVTGSRPAPATSLVQRFDSDGDLADAWDATGSAPGQLDRPESVAPAPDGSVYTTECGINRLSHFTADGQLISYWLEQRFLGSRQVCSPSDVAVGPDGHVYTADAANDRVAHLVGDDLVTLVGSPGTGDGQFEHPTKLAVGPDGTLYVLDLGNDRVQRFAADGTFLSSFGGQGDHNGQLRLPTDLAIDGAGRVYVSDTTRDLVQVYTADGRYLARWSVETPNLAAQTAPDGTVLVHTTPTISNGGALTGAIRTYAFAPGALVGAQLTPATTQVDPGRTASFTLRIDNLGAVALTGLTVDAGILSGCGGATADLAPGASRSLTCTYVPEEADAGEFHARVTVDADQIAPEPSNTAWVEVRLRKVQRWGSAGAGPGRFADPDGIAARAGRVYVADCGNDRVQQFDGSTAFVRAWGTPGTGDGQFDCPTDVTIASTGNVLVVDSGNGRVQEFTAHGAFVRAWSSQTPSGGTPHAIDVDDDDNVYVVDSNNSSNTGGRNTVRRFTPTGTLVTTFPNAGNRYRPSGIWITSAGVLHLVGAGQTMDTYDLSGTFLGSLTLGPTSAYSAHEVALDLQGNLWMTVPSLNEVRKLTATGTVLGRWTIPGPTGITIAAGEVYVTTTTDRVVKLGVRDPGTGITGRVTEDGSGDPIPGAAVLALRRDDYTLLAAANADANGDYRLELAPGDYAIEFADPTGAHGYEWYEDRPTPEGITTVTVTSGSLTTVSGALAPARGSVAGTVTELAGGAPVDGITVLAVRTGAAAASSGAVGGRAVTDPAGRYRLTGLDPGDYFVAMVDLENRFATPAVVPVTVTDGGTATADAALDPRPSPAGAVTGTVLATTTSSGNATSAPLPGALVVGLDPADLHLVAAAATSNTGAYELQVPSGDVLVAFVDPLGRHAFEWYDDQTEPASFDDVARVRAGDTANATLARTTGDLTGTVSGTDTNGVAVLAVRPTGIAGATLTNSSGVYTISHLPPTTYLLVYIDPTGNYRANFYRNQSLTTLASRVTVSAGVRTNLSSQSMEAW
ncbi:MAG: carboxypeptidase regulatory-like domain-containing protein [Acidimicrobiales bacterium]|nr:carboxypeptidase regulatory-like domain-containing protein [Acidimicrobiales bacterium]